METSKIDVSVSREISLHTKSATLPEQHKCCNYCKYYIGIDKNQYKKSVPDGYRLKNLYPGLGMCSKDEYTSIMNLSTAYYKKRYYYQTCDGFVYSIRNWNNIEDLSELTEFPELRRAADLFREEVKYSYPAGWMV